MLRRLSVTLIRRSFVVLLLICLGCVAQMAPNGAANQASNNDLPKKIERQVRSYYSLPPEVHVTVGAITPSSDWPNFDAVSVSIEGGDAKKSDYKFLLSKDRATMLRMVKFDLTKDPFADLMSKINVTGRPTRGAKSAKVVVVNFDDFECPFCSRMHQTLFPEILKEYGDRVTFVYKDFPLEMHPWAIHAAVDANCLAAQNGDAYWDFADYIHANQREVSGEPTPGARLAALDRMTLLQGQKHNLDAAKLQSCVKAQDEGAVKASLKEGDDLGINATPTIFINGQKLDGAVPIGEVRAALDQALKDAGQPVPDHSSAAPGPASK
jgi:protein-disulfide isomerase